MLLIKRISMRNFFSFGNAPQVVDFDSTDIALVLGQNNDAVIEGGDNAGRRNGVGKSAIIQGLVFGLYGKSIGNDIKIPNLVNKTNTKNCEVIVEFNKDGVDYRVERGRSPTYFNFITVGSNKSEDESRGEKKDTQEDLSEILGISQMLFEHIVVLNANVEPFLSLSQQKQRDMIEELLGITQLTEKAELLKDMLKETRRLADQEKFKIETLTASNKRIEQSIDSLQQQANKFESDKNQRVEKLQSELSNYDGIDFEGLYTLADQKEAALAHNLKKAGLDMSVNDLAGKYTAYESQLIQKKDITSKLIQNLSTIDITEELKRHDELQAWLQLDSILKDTLTNKRFKDQRLSTLKVSLSRSIEALESEVSKLQTVEDSKCPLCESKLEHDAKHSSMKEQIRSSIDKITQDITTFEQEIATISQEISEMEIFDMPPKPTTVYPTVSEAKLHEHKLEELQKQLDEEPVNIYNDALLSAYDELNAFVLMEVPETFNKTEVKELELNKQSLTQQLERELSTKNTFFDQIETLRSTSLQPVDYNEYNELDKLGNHQDFMVKLLLNKDSYVRKRIIEQNISFLNSRLQSYIDMCGSEHSVKFMNDLSVEIMKGGQSYDFKQLSRGERTRVNIALSVAFRDTYESLYQNINLIMIDEMIDVGLDSSGVMRVWSIFQDQSAVRQKNVFVISHRDELLHKTDNILKIVKEDGFSSIEHSSIDDIY